MTEKEAIDCIALCQSLPGVIAINMATYIGHHIAGLKGSIAATLGVLTPSYIIIIMMVEFLQKFQQNIYVEGALLGIKGAAAGLICFAAYSVFRQVVHNIKDFIFALGTFLAIVLFNINGIYAIVCGLFLGIILGILSDKKQRNFGERKKENKDDLS